MHTCIHAYMHTCIHAYMHTCNVILYNHVRPNIQTLKKIYSNASYSLPHLCWPSLLINFSQAFTLQHSWSINPFHAQNSNAAQVLKQCTSIFSYLGLSNYMFQCIAMAIDPMLPSAIRGGGQLRGSIGGRAGGQFISKATHPPDCCRPAR